MERADIPSLNPPLPPPDSRKNNRGSAKVDQKQVMRIPAASLRRRRPGKETAGRNPAAIFRERSASRTAETSAASGTEAPVISFLPRPQKHSQAIFFVKSRPGSGPGHSPLVRQPKHWRFARRYGDEIKEIDLDPVTDKNHLGSDC
ncbi:MAG: hypothetical protein LBU64_05395 [Planctomycetota bacterium]|jgi:hypothetical protein|nr:hypothetical protein [Planctomycetota bacterium]